MKLNNTQIVSIASLAAVIVLVFIVGAIMRNCSGGSNPETEEKEKTEKVEKKERKKNDKKDKKSKKSDDDKNKTLVKYPGRTFSYSEKFNDNQTKQLNAAKAIGLAEMPKDRNEASKMRRKLTKIKTDDNYIVDSLAHSVPYLVPAAAKELESIGEEFADILKRNNLPHYRFYVTSVLRTKEDVEDLQKSNGNATTNSCHCYGTTFDLAYYRYDKVTRTHEYMSEDNLKLVLGQVLLNHQRAGKIYVKYEQKQACFHVTVRK